MGSNLSTLSKEDVASAVAAQGSKCEVYAQALIDNGVDGDLLAGINLEGQDEELSDIFDELEIKSKLHRKVLTNALRRARKEEQSKLVESPTATAEPSQNHPDDQAQQEIQDIPEYFEAAALFDLDIDTPDDQVEPFDQLAQDVLSANPRATFAAVNLILKDAQHPISVRRRGGDGSSYTDRRIAYLPHKDSVCYYLVHDPSRDTLIKDLPQGNPFGPTYIGHVLKDKDGKRVGALCQVAEIANEEDRDHQIAMLRRLAAIAERTLEERLTLQERSRKLKTQIASTSAGSSDDEIVLPGCGPIEPILKTQLLAAPTYNDYPSPEEIKAGGKPRNSSLLPVFKTDLASPEEQGHLPPDLFAAVDASGMPRPPIGRNDMERVAAVEALELHKMDPDGPDFMSLRNLIATAAQMFRMPLAQISYHNHAKEFAFCPFSSGLTEHQKAQCDEFVEEILIKDSVGAPFLGQRGRGNAVCNYPIHSKRIFVVHDLWEDEAFTMYRDLKFIRSYVGCPILSAKGHVIAMLCMFDFKPRPDFGKAHELQTNSIARIISQTFENWGLKREIKRLEEERQQISLRLDADKLSAPTGEVTFVFTDIQHSTVLWEKNAPIMEDALKIHDSIMRKCCAESWGYEITTEGDAFLLAFHDPFDAVSFALKVQSKLYWAEWPRPLLEMPEASEDPRKSLRGLRVRIGIHHGAANTGEHEVTGRVRYSGLAARLTKNVEAMCHGSQILVTVDAWRIASSVPESLGSPQVLDLGEHIVITGNSLSEGIISKRILQLVPSEFAYDFSAALQGTAPAEETGLGKKNATALRGRLFPPILSKRQLSPSFHDAPHKDNSVTIAFIYSPGLEKLDDDAIFNATLSILGKLLRPLLHKTNGYECKEDRGIWMTAFNTPLAAVQFGLMLLESVRTTALLNPCVDTSHLVKVGIVADRFTRMGPHPTTGRADYYGPVVNRAARVAGAANAGEVYLGVPHVDPEIVEPIPPALGGSVTLQSQGMRALKGVTEPVALYACSGLLEQ